MMEARLSKTTVTRAWRCGDAIRPTAACTEGTQEMGEADYDAFCDGQCKDMASGAAGHHKPAQQTQ